MKEKTQSQTPLSQIYKATYEALFKKLSTKMQERVLAVKSNNEIKDFEVNEFVRTVCFEAERREAAQELKLQKVAGANKKALN